MVEWRSDKSARRREAGYSGISNCDKLIATLNISSIHFMNPLHRLYYRYFFLRTNFIANAVIACVGTPRRATRETWNREYREGNWARLHHLSEQPHNAVLLAYIEHLRPQGSILEIGCGDGVLLHYLKHFGYSRYLGIDISDVAIEKCQSSKDATTDFLVRDAETYTPDFTPDVIVLNESIYYFAHPTEILKRYSQYLASDGIIVVSIYDHYKTRPIVRRIKTDFCLLNDTTVSERIGSWHGSWHCFALSRGECQSQLEPRNQSTTMRK